MRIVIDTNVFLDYAENRDYAVDFFKRAKNNCWEIYVLEDVYAEAKRLCPRFNKIMTLINELCEVCQSYHRVRLTDEERRLAEEWRGRCDRFGEPLDRADRRIVAVAKTRRLAVFSKDDGVIRLAKSEKVRTL